MSEVRSRIAHLYRRAGFGARPDELDAMEEKGYEAAVESLLAGLTTDGAEPIPAPALSTGSPSRATTPRARQQDEARQLEALQEWWLGSMIASTTPLREKLTLLWSGHFATGFAKVRNAAWMYRQNQLFRRLGAGSFDALTVAVAQDPAMQVWLDTDTDVVAHPNENFARELMELFTLGLGNYSEDDVHQAARCFTGWSFNRATGDFVLRTRLHDHGQKTVLGHRGDFDGDELVRTITHLPVSARFVTAKLWSHLAYPISPADSLVTDLAAGFAKDLDITRLLGAIFLHPEFTGSVARTGLVKQPLEYVVGVARSLGLGPAGASPPSTKPAPVSPGPASTPAVRPQANLPALQVVSRLLGQEPFNPPNVGGWPQNEYWLTPATAAVRWQFASAAAGSADLSALESVARRSRPDAVARVLSVDGWGPTTRGVLSDVAGEPVALLALALCSPEYVIN